MILQVIKSSDKFAEMKSHPSRPLKGKLIILQKNTPLGGRGVTKNIMP